MDPAQPSSVQPESPASDAGPDHYRALTDAMAESRASEARYQALFAAMDQGFCIIEKMATAPGTPSDFRYIAANPAFLRHTGLPDPVGRTILELVPAAEATTMDVYDRVVATGQPERFEVHVAQLALWMEAEAFPTPERGRIAVLFSNVSARRQAEDALRKSQQRYRTIVEHAIDYAIFTISNDGSITSWPPGARAVFGWEAEEIIGQPSALTFTDADQAAGVPERELNQARARGKAPDVRWHVRKNGSLVFFRGSSYALHDEHGHVEGFFKIGRDATAQHEWEALLQERVATATTELRALAHRLLRVQEDERHHLAWELHDQIGQLLTGLDMQLGAVSNGDPDALRDARSTIADMIRHVRDLAIGLRPTTFDMYGLLPTLRTHIARYSAQTGVSVGLQYEGEERRYDPTVEITAFRIVQEALTNVARHADTRQVDVHVIDDGDLLLIRIHDNGFGFDLHSEAAADGLRDMQERADLVGGQLTIEAAIGEGVTILAELPITA
jgi:PAS domain S-box-containing protein